MTYVKRASGASVLIITIKQVYFEVGFVIIVMLQSVLQVTLQNYFGS